MQLKAPERETAPGPFVWSNGEQMFKRIGAFHMCKGHEDPVAALKRELESKDATDALIVLPEAFNLGAHYRSNAGVPKFGRGCVIGQLKAIAQDWKSAFIVGLLEPPPVDRSRPHSSAYFVSATNTP